MIKDVFFAWWQEACVKSLFVDVFILLPQLHLQLFLFWLQFPGEQNVETIKSTLHVKDG